MHIGKPSATEGDMGVRNAHPKPAHIMHMGKPSAKVQPATAQFNVLSFEAEDGYQNGYSIIVGTSVLADRF